MLSFNLLFFSFSFLSLPFLCPSSSSLLCCLYSGCEGGKRRKKRNNRRIVGRAEKKKYKNLEEKEKLPLFSDISLPPFH